MAAEMEQVWQREVSQTLGRLEKGVEDLTEQVKRQNGNVASLTARMTAVEQAQASITADKHATEKESAKWDKWKDRAILAAITVLAWLALNNAPLMLKAMKVG